MGLERHDGEQIMEFPSLYDLSRQDIIFGVTAVWVYKD